LSAELTEEVESMAELEEHYRRDEPFWLVVVRAEGKEGKVKVRGPEGGMEEVKWGEVAEWLRVEMGRRGKERRK
jgi:hypothetical protein